MRRLKHSTKWLAAATLVAASALPIPCVAQRNAPYSPPPERQPSTPPPRAPQQPEGHWESRPGQRAQQGHAGDWLRRYKDLPANEQRRALENDPEFRRLPPWRQQELRQRLNHFSSLPPQQQQRMLMRMEIWEHLTPEQKQQARQVFRQWQQLRPDRRHQVAAAIHDLRAMPPEQRERVLNSDRFRSMFSPWERDLMRGVTRLPLAPPPENGDQPGPQE